MDNNATQRMTIRAELINLTKKDLLNKATKLEIVGRWRMNKDELTQAVYTVLIKEIHDEPIKNYKQEMKIGTLVAFAAGKRLLTGVVKSIHGDGFSIETKNGIKHTISNKQVMWVKTGSRWPKHIFDVLKGEAGIETICPR